MSKSATVKFRIGDRVRRDPSIWSDAKYGIATNIGTVMAVLNTEGEPAYRIIPDRDIDGIMNFFTNELEPSSGVYYLESELFHLED